MTEAAYFVPQEIEDVAVRCKLVTLGFNEGRVEAAGNREQNRGAGLIPDIVLENASMSAGTGLPICQDMGIDVVFVDVGPDCVVDRDMVSSINRGIASGTKTAF